MTEKELLAEYQITLREFGPEEWDHDGFFDSVNRIIYINSGLSPRQRRTVLLHELGHLDHYLSLYENATILCENEADRFMIHHLVKDTIEQLDDPRDFNYLGFMEYYNLKTITNAIMVKEEYRKLAIGK